MTHYKYLIIGGGMTADCAVRGIRQLDGEGSIGLIGEEPYPPYDRAPLSKGLWRRDSAEDIWRNTQEQGVTRDIGRAICSEQVKNGSIQVAHLDTLRSRFEDVKWSNGWVQTNLRVDSRRQNLRICRHFVVRSAGLEPATF
jgi:hypothetical protein